MRSARTKAVLLPMAILCTLFNVVYANNLVSLINVQPQKIYHTINNKTLLEVTNQIANRTGFTFKIHPELKKDIINQKLAADEWTYALEQLLQGYNYSIVRESGIIKTVLITGYNGNGHINDATTVAEQDLLMVAPSIADLPEKYRHYKPGSVFRLNLPMTELASKPLGSELTLDLPIGQYKVKHDNVVDQGDGSTTWMGYLNEEGKGYRVYLSEGEAGIMGNIYTPDGAYNIETVDGVTVLVDLERSGLQAISFENDLAEPSANALMQAGMNAVADAGKKYKKHKVAGAAYTKKSKNKQVVVGSNNLSGTVVDLMVLYTTKKQTASYAKHRIKYLVAVTNQAYLDSGINMSLRLVHTRQTSYVENNANATALSDLATSRGAFKGTASLRNKYGADLVMLFRPLYAQTAGSCGTTYVGFAYGGDGIPEYGYGTIGDGSSNDALSGYYCGPNTFAHEIGHSLGNVHDRENSSFTGKFPYSYAWGIRNVFGTIMSTYGPPIMLFSNPNLTAHCAGSPCGFPDGTANSSDQAATTNFTGPIVGSYRATTVGKPVIQ